MGYGTGEVVLFVLKRGEFLVKNQYSSVVYTLTHTQLHSQPSIPLALQILSAETHICTEPHTDGLHPYAQLSTFCKRGNILFRRMRRKKQMITHIFYGKLCPGSLPKMVN